MTSHTVSALSAFPTAADLPRLHHAELALADSAAALGGLVGLVSTAGGLSDRPQWLIGGDGRMVACTPSARSFSMPGLDTLAEACGTLDAVEPAATLAPAAPTRGLPRRHLIAPVTRRGITHAWWVVAETPRLFEDADRFLASRVAHHLATEYDAQHRVARAAWNARSLLARQLVRGSGPEDDLVASGEYLGVDVDSRRLVVYLSDPATRDPTDPTGSGLLRPGRAGPGSLTGDEVRAAARLASALGVEVLGARGNQGTILLVEAPADRAASAFVHEVKNAVRHYLHPRDDGSAEPGAAVGISAVTDRSGLRRAYREAREVARCVDRFSPRGERILAVDDLGPARLFVANAEASALHSYVSEILGPLLDGDESHRVLLRTLQAFFDRDRSVRASARALGIHENTIRLRLGRVRELTGLDVAGHANDQLSVQTALLVLQLTGALPARGSASPQTHLPDQTDQMDQTKYQSDLTSNRRIA